MAVDGSRVVLGWSDGHLQVAGVGGGPDPVHLSGGSVRHIQLHGGELFVACWSGIVHVVDLTTLASAVVVEDLPHPLHALQMTSDLLLLSCGDGNIPVFRVLHAAGTGAVLVRKHQVLSGHVGAIQDMQVEGPVLVTAGVDRTVRCV